MASAQNQHGRQPKERKTASKRADGCKLNVLGVRNAARSSFARSQLRLRGTGGGPECLTNALFESSGKNRYIALVDSSREGSLG